MTDCVLGLTINIIIYQTGKHGGNCSQTYTLSSLELGLSFGPHYAVQPKQTYIYFFCLACPFSITFTVGTNFQVSPHNMPKIARLHLITRLFNVMSCMKSSDHISSPSPVLINYCSVCMPMSFVWLFDVITSGSPSFALPLHFCPEIFLSISV